MSFEATLMPIRSPLMIDKCSSVTDGVTFENLAIHQRVSSEIIFDPVVSTGQRQDVTSCIRNASMQVEAGEIAVTTHVDTGFF